MNFENQLAAT
jgi:hypothetical protein